MSAFKFYLKKNQFLFTIKFKFIIYLGLEEEGSREGLVQINRTARFSRICF